MWLDRLVRQGRAFGVHVDPGLAEPGRGVHAGAEHARSDGRADRASVQRKRCPFDPERKQHRTADALATGRGDLQRRQRRSRGQPFLPGGLADGRAARGLSQASCTTWRQRRKPILARTPIVFEGDAPADLARNPMLRERLAAPRLARFAALDAGVGRRRDLDQGPDVGPVPAPGGKPSLDRRPERRGRDRRHDLDALEPGRPVSGRHVRTRFGRGRASSCSTARRKIIPARACWPGSPAVLPHGVDVGDWREVPRVLAEVGGRAHAPPGVQDRRSRALPVHPRSAAVPRPAAPRRRLQLLEARRRARARPITSMRSCAKGRCWAFM